MEGRSMGGAQQLLMLHVIGQMILITACDSSGDEVNASCDFLGLKRR